MPSGHERADQTDPSAVYTPDRRDLLKLIGVGSVAGLAGCTSDDDGADGGSTDAGTSTATAAPEDATRTVGGDFVAVSGTDAESLNWLTIADNTSGSYIGRMLDGAWGIAEGGEIFPLWAEPSTDEGRVWEITLRDDLRWGAGYGQMTADDWVYMIREVFQAEENWTGYTNRDDWFRNDDPIPVERTGALSFTLELPEVDPSFAFKPVMWGQNAMPKGLLEKYVPDRDGEGLKQDEEIQTIAYAGNLGPYTYEEWDRDSQLVTVRNDDYYLGKLDSLLEKFRDAPFFERNVVRVIKEESARLGALETGEVTAAAIPPNKASRFQEMESVDAVVTPQPYISVLAYNMRANGWTPFRRKAVRQALAHAVNKQAIADNIERGFAQVAQTMQPKWTKWYDDSRITNYGVGENYGPDRTRELLGEALSDTEYGYDGDALVDGDGARVSLSLFFQQASETNRTTAEFVAQEFGANAGIDVTLQGTSSFIGNYVANSPPEGTEAPWSSGAYNGGPRTVSVSTEPWNMSIALGFNTYPYTPSSSVGFFRERGDINYYGYVPSEGVDIASLYQEASRTVDEGERKALFGEAFGLINDEQPFGFLTMSSDITGYQDELVGPTPVFENGWDSMSWYFREQ